MTCHINDEITNKIHIFFNYFIVFVIPTLINDKKISIRNYIGNCHHKYFIAIIIRHY